MNPIQSITSGFRGVIEPDPAVGRKNASGTESRETLETACREFESLFISIMLKTMRETVPQSGSGVDGLGSDIYTGLMDSQLARQLSEAGGIGLAEKLRPYVDRSHSDPQKFSEKM